MGWSEGSRLTGGCRWSGGIYRQANGKYAVCIKLNGKLCFRTARRGEGGRRVREGASLRTADELTMVEIEDLISGTTPCPSAQDLADQLESYGSSPLFPARPPPRCGYDLELARAQRESFVRAARFGVLAGRSTVAAGDGRWLVA
jgi:hypothetical protein